MVNLIKHIYRAVIPESARSKILEAKKKRIVEKQKQEILAYYKTVPAVNITSEIKEVLTYLEHNPLHVFPYEFQKNYPSQNVTVHTDDNGLSYVLHHGKKLFFKRSWSAERIKDSYSFLSCEQHPTSPHRYLTDKFFINDNSVVADAGAAEGIFALEHIEKIKHLYLFETDHEWIEALEATYAPWKEKVTIVNKFVANKNDEKHVSLDTYFNSAGNLDFIKIDVDGAETELLNGASQILASPNKTKIAICTYHQQQDEQEFGSLLRKNGFTVSTSDGYMLFYFEGIFEKPYLRRGLIRAQK